MNPRQTAKRMSLQAAIARIDSLNERQKRQPTIVTVQGYDAVIGAVIGTTASGGSFQLPFSATNGQVVRGAKITIQLDNGRGLYDATNQ